MALTERSRSALYQRLTDLTEDEVAVGELLSYFPTRDVEEPATKEFVAAQVADVRSEFAELRVEMAAMEARLTALAAAQLRVSIQWTLGALISLMGLVVAMGFLRGP
jgi:hypothetical protein